VSFSGSVSVGISFSVRLLCFCFGVARCFFNSGSFAFLWCFVCFGSTRSPSGFSV
jgi:hypothetical protein